MYIEVPITRRKVNEQKCAKKALAMYLSKKRCSKRDLDTSLFDIEIEKEYVYVPYWIGVVETSKERALPIYPDKKITFYIVCDAIDGNYIVLRNLPKTKSIQCVEDRVIPALISEKRFAGHIINEAEEERINGQFIFGKPHIVSEGYDEMYLPMRKVNIARKGQIELEAFCVNLDTGEVKKYQ